LLAPAPIALCTHTHTPQGPENAQKKISNGKPATVVETELQKQVRKILGLSQGVQLLWINGIVHPTAVLICPYIATVANTGFSDVQWKSPFDTCPATTALLSLADLQVSVGGQNVLQSNLNMTYANF
jgi:hypothetical protein